MLKQDQADVITVSPLSRSRILVTLVCAVRAVLRSGSLPRTRGSGNMGSAPGVLCVRLYPDDTGLAGGFVSWLCAHDGRCAEVTSGRSASSVTKLQDSQSHPVVRSRSQIR